MRGVSRWAIACLIALAMASIASLCTAQAPDFFRWIDFNSSQDQDVVVWVTRALDGQKWTAIREIGVQYDAALVITTLRSSPQASPNRDTFSIWSVSLENRALTHIVDGTNLRLADWLLLNVGEPRELGVLYDDCNDCEATTYFTALRYDLRNHSWAARWLQDGGKTIPVWTAKAPLGVTQTQLYAVMADSNGHEVLGTWNHMDYGKAKPAEEFVYRYDLDPASSVERTQLLFGRDAAGMKDRLCRAQDAVPGLFRGQDSALCETGQKAHYERKPVTTPPLNNQGQSKPPGTRQ
ncbi:MAG TPA: hypothetical protein VKB47_02270 [Terracidiphilus sp.]|nr:hypothetical protein [Terracidiphilus sp.]